MDGRKTSGKKTPSGFSPHAERKFSAKGPRKKPPEAPSMVLVEEVLADQRPDNEADGTTEPEGIQMALTGEGVGETVSDALVGKPKAFSSSSGAPTLKKQFYKKLSPEDKSMYIIQSILNCFMNIENTGRL